MLTGEIVTPKEFAHEQALAKAIVTALGEFMDARTQDLPHRFRAPASFAQYMQDYGVNSTYHSIPIYGSSNVNYMTLEMTTRPTQKIFEITFQGADGMRLFTLEIEYGDAIQKTREVLLP
jgi:ABC-type transporter lipoprotein component MlaA